MASKKSILSKTEKIPGIESLIKGKQPVVHSTFRLNQEAHSAIKELAAYYGETIAELFEKLLIIFGEHVSLVKIEGEEKIRKTYVVRKDTLAKLNKLVKANNTTRDL